MRSRTNSYTAAATRFCAMNATSLGSWVANHVHRQAGNCLPLVPMSHGALKLIKANVETPSCAGACAQSAQAPTPAAAR